MKGIIITGGCGTRLYPLTFAISKQFLPIYVKPMIYYPLSVLMKAGIKEVLIISTPYDMPKFKELLGNEEKVGIKLSYCIQPSSNGIAQAYIIAKDFCDNTDVCLISGDNILYSGYLVKFLRELVVDADKRKATIFGYYVNVLNGFEIVELDNSENVLSLEEKLDFSKSNYAITGLYFYPNGVCEYAQKVIPSKKSELEIISLTDASCFVKSVEEHTWLEIACLDEISFLNWWISKNDLLKTGNFMKNSEYGKYSLNVVFGK